ncbi:MAG: glycosyltransferase family 39 protein [Chloroflexota bacterium]
MLKEKLITIAGIFAVIVLYLWGHNIVAPSGEIPQQIYLLSIVFILYDLGLVAFLLAIAGGIGRFALRTLAFDNISVGERVAIEAMLGLGIISLFVATVGLLGYFGIYLWLAVLVAGMICIRQVFAWLGHLRDLLLRSGKPTTPWERFVRSFIVVTLVSALILALAPPYAWDAINYHLLIPQRYIADGAITQHLDNHFFGFPQNMEMLYGLFMMLGSDRAPAVLHWAIGSLGVMTVYNFVRRYTSGKAAAFSVLVLMASFGLWQLFTRAYVDVALFTLSAVAVVSITQWSVTEKDKQSWLILTALLASIAAGTKYTSASLLVGIYALILLRDPKNAVRNTLIYGGFGVLLFTPWLIKGAFLYENPVYPYIFDGPNWDSIRSENFSDSGNGLIGQGLWAHIPILPFAVTTFGITNTTPYSFVSGAFLLTMPFVLLVGWWSLGEEQRRVARDLLPIVFVILVFFMILAAVSGIGGQVRLSITGLPLAAILGGFAFYSLEQWQRRPLDMMFLTQSAIILTLLFTVPEHISYFTDSRVLEFHTSDRTADTTTDSYLSNNVQGALYDAMLEIEALPEGSRVLFLWEPKAYYCPAHITCTGDLLFDNWARPLQLGATPDELIAEWQANYDYFLLFDIDSEEAPNGFSLWRDLQEFATERNNLFPTYFYPAVTEEWTLANQYTLYSWAE